MFHQKLPSMKFQRIYKVKFKTGTKKLIGVMAGCDFGGAWGYDFQANNGTFYKHILEGDMEMKGEEVTND